jgi:hypothetical protein
MNARSLLVRQLECLPCSIEGVPQPFHTEAHHLNSFGLAGQKRRGDAFQIPCCGWHHRGQLLPGIGIDAMTHKYGPSLATDSRQFRHCYGDDNSLLTLTNAQLERQCPQTA